MIRHSSVASVSAAADHYQHAVTLYKQGEYNDALKQVSLGLQADIEHKPLYLLARDILGKLEGAEERRLFAIALNDFNEFQPFFDLGYHFIDTGYYALAAAFLAKALRLKPDSVDAAYELAFARMTCFQITEAIQALASVKYEDDFWAAYLYYQCRLWLQQPEGVQDFIQDAHAMLDAQTPNDSLEIARYKITELAESLERYQQIIPQTPAHIRDWHFIQYGAAVLDYFEQNDELQVAGGRYVALWGSLQDVRTVLEQLVRYLTTLERLPKRVLALPNRDAEIIGRAAAHLLNLPFELLETVQDFSHTLIVGADTTSFNGLEPLIDVQAGQTIFALQQPWLERSMIVPDVVGFIAQNYWLPWADGQLRFNEATQDVESVEADTRSVDEIVQDLLAQPLDAESLAAFEHHLAFYQPLQAWLKGGAHSGAKRSPYAIESPVAGSSFS